MFAISFVTLIFAKDYAHFVFSMVTLTLGESTAMPAMPAYVNDLSPVESKGPLFGGLVIDKFGYINFFIVAAAGIFMMLAIIVPLHAQLKDKLKIFR